MVLQVLKPLYGIPESGLHLYLTYVAYHMEHLGMECSMEDHCMLIRKHEGNLDGIRVLQVDVILGPGTTAFLEDEDTQSKLFRSKARRHIAVELVWQDFNGTMITRLND